MASSLFQLAAPISLCKMIRESIVVLVLKRKKVRNRRRNVYNIICLHALKEYIHNLAAELHAHTLAGLYKNIMIIIL